MARAETARASAVRRSAAYPSARTLGHRAIKVRKAFVFAGNDEPDLSVSVSCERGGRAPAPVLRADALRPREERLGHRDARGARRASARHAALVDRRELPGGRAEAARRAARGGRRRCEAEGRSTKAAQRAVTACRRLPIGYGPRAVLPTTTFLASISSSGTPCRLRAARRRVRGARRRPRPRAAHARSSSFAPCPASSRRGASAPSRDGADEPTRSPWRGS
jgi:hypothetical protein